MTWRCPIPRTGGVFSGMVPAEIGSTKSGNLNQSENKTAIGYVSGDSCSAASWADPIALGTKKLRNCKSQIGPSGVWESFSPGGAVTPWCKSGSGSDEAHGEKLLQS